MTEIKRQMFPGMPDKAKLKGDLREIKANFRANKEMFKQQLHEQFKGKKDGQKAGENYQNASGMFGGWFNKKNN